MKKIIKQSKSRLNKRFVFLVIFIILCFLLLEIRLFQLQILSRDRYEKILNKQIKLEVEIPAERGKIFVKDKENKYYKIADNQIKYILYADNRKIVNPKKVAELVSSILKIDEKILEKKLSFKDDPYVRLSNNVTEEQKKMIETFNIKGLGLEKKISRYYPDKELFSHITGFLGYKQDKITGQYGIEQEYDEELKGETGILKGEKDLKNRIITFGENVIKLPIPGKDIYLTLDRYIQFKACEELKKGIEKFKADSGSVIVMNSYTGEILAMCNYPWFNPNKYFEVKDTSYFINQAITYSYEPGSVFKPFTIAIGLDLGVIDPYTKYYDKGYIKIGKYTITNAASKTFGESSIVDVLDKSINTGAVFVASKINLNRFNFYIKKFGFGRLTGINLPYETEGDISNLDKKNFLYIATASFGQGISVTPIQLITSFSALINGGELIKPKIVDFIVDFNGKKRYIRKEKIAKVISSLTSQKIKAMLISVVEEGFGKLARIKGYKVGGKTGTAQVPEKGKYTDNTIHTFIGFAPSSGKFVVLVKLDNPKNVKWASYSSADVFREIMRFILIYYGIPKEI